MNGEFPENKTLLEDRQKHFLPTAYHYHKEPVQLVKAQGAYVWDQKDNRFLDAIGGIVSISSGHNHPKIKQALIRMLENDEIQHTSLLYLTKYPIELAKRLTEETPKGMDQVSFTNSGSEANELAIMAARQSTGETIVMSLQHGYHGGTSGALAQCGHHTWRFRAQPNASTTSALAPNCYRCPFQKKRENCNLECAKHIEETIQTTSHGKIAAFIAEPIMGVGGFITPPDEYFHEVVKIVHNYGGKYISDEVQTGAGRCGSKFLLTTELDFDADMITMAKGFGNGAPIGAVVMKPEIGASMKGKLYFNTFGGDPYQSVQAKINMDIIEEENLIENSKLMGALLKDGLSELMKKHPLIGDVRGRGLLVGFELVKDRKTKEYASEEAALLMDQCKDRGLLIGKGGLFGNVIRLAPPLCINHEDASFMLKVIDESLSEVSKTHV